MKHFIFGVAFALCVVSFVISAAPQEVITLTTPVFVDTGKTTFRVWMLMLRRTHPDSPAEARAVYREVVAGAFVANGRDLNCFYSGATADGLILGLNTANLNPATGGKSLERRLIERCQLDKQLGPGVISGAPQ